MSMSEPDPPKSAIQGQGQSTDLAAAAATWPSMQRFLGRYKDISTIPDEDPARKPLQGQREALAKFYPEHFKNGRAGLWVADPTYVSQRLEKWATLTDRLSADPILIEARQKWAGYDESKRVDTLRHIGGVTLDVLGHTEGNLHVVLQEAKTGQEFAEHNGNVVFYLRMDKDGYIDKGSKLFNDFETIAAGMVHETFHEDQDILQHKHPQDLTKGEQLQREYIELADKNYIRARPEDMKKHPERVERDSKLYYFNPKEGEANLALQNIGKNGESKFAERGWKEIIGNPERGQEMSAMLRSRAVEIDRDLRGAITQGKPYDFVHCRFDQETLTKPQPVTKAFTCSMTP